MLRDFFIFHRWGVSGVIHNNLKYYIKEKKDVIQLARYIIFRSDRLLGYVKKKEYSYYHLLDEINLLCAIIMFVFDYFPNEEITFETVQLFVNGCGSGSSTDLLIKDYEKQGDTSLAFRFFESYRIKDSYIRLDTVGSVSTRLSLLYLCLDHSHDTLNSTELISSTENHAQENNNERMDDNMKNNFNPYRYVKETLSDNQGHSRKELSEKILNEGYSQESVDNIFNSFPIDWNEQLKKRVDFLLHGRNGCSNIRDFSKELLELGFSIDDVKRISSETAYLVQLCYNCLMSYASHGNSLWSFEHLFEQLKYEGFTSDVCNSAVEMMTDEDREILYNNNLRYVETWYCAKSSCTRNDLVTYLASEKVDSDMSSYIFENGNFDFQEKESKEDGVDYSYFQHDDFQPLISDTPLY